MRIAIFDYKIIRNNPVGSCHLRVLEGLSKEHEFVVFATQFENPDPDRIRFVRVPVPTRPLALLFVCFHLVAPLCYIMYRLFGGGRFDLVQTVESNCLVKADVCYSHFCHRRFLKQHWPALKLRGLRAALRYLDHRLHALMEPAVFRRARNIVCPSRGLERELGSEYPSTAPKLSVLSNPVQCEKMRRPDDFDRNGARAKLELSDTDLLLTFVALGHFERKGLPLLLEALAQVADSTIKLVVVGGEADLVRAYGARAQALGLGPGQVKFVGMQSDVRPYLWMADAFVLPSAYEVFPLVVLEAAAAGVPIIVTPLNGVEEFCVDGVNGFVVERSAEGLRRTIERLRGLSLEARQDIALRAQNDVRRYSVTEFHASWRKIYSSLRPERELASHYPGLGHRV